jgi:hypothetical protein
LSRIYEYTPLIPIPFPDTPMRTIKMPFDMAPFRAKI